MYSHLTQFEMKIDTTPKNIDTTIIQKNINMLYYKLELTLSIQLQTYKIKYNTFIQSYTLFTASFILTSSKGQLHYIPPKLLELLPGNFFIIAD